MKTVSSIIQNNKATVIPMITESQLFINYGSSLDSALNKFRTFGYNQLTNRINETHNDFTFTLNESIAVNNMFRFICEDYINALTKECEVLEAYLNDEITLNEALGIVDVTKNLWNQSKEKVKEVIDTTKTKIKEIKDFISDIANKAIKTIKDAADRLMVLLSKFNCTIAELFKKVGLKSETFERSWNKTGEEIAKNVDKIKNNDVYGLPADNVFENFGKELQTYVYEAVELNPEGATKNTSEEVEGSKKGKKSIKQQLWEAFKQFAIWAVVCVVIPGTVCAVFPGTFIALIVPLVCKLAWNGYKIYKIWEQFKKIRKEWPSYKKINKIVAVISMVASIVALFFNFKSFFSEGGKILSAFDKVGGDVVTKLMSKANIGIQPDALTRGWAAFITMIKEGKFSVSDFGDAYKEISDSFAKHTVSIVKKVVKHTAKIGKSAADTLNEFEAGSWSSSTNVWTKWLYKIGIDPTKIPGKGVYEIAMDGSSKADWMKKLKAIADKMGETIEIDDSLNKGLNRLCSNAGSITGVKISGRMLKYCIDNGIDLGHNSFKVVDGVMKGISILGGNIDTTSVVTKVTNGVQAATSMLITIPSIELTPSRQNGFFVRLGDKDSKNYIYKIPRNGVKEESIEDTGYLNNLIKQTEEYHKALLDSAKDDSEKKKIQENIDNFNDNFNKNVKNLKKIVFYGTLANDNDKDMVSESQIISLSQYLINESKSDYTIGDLKQNLRDLRKYIDDLCNSKDSKDENGKSKYAGNNAMLLKSIFKFGDKGAGKLDWEDDKDYAKLHNDDKSKYPYSIKKRVTDKIKENDLISAYDIEKFATMFGKMFSGSDTEKVKQALVDVVILKKYLREANDDLNLSDDNAKEIVEIYQLLINNLKGVNDEFKEHIKTKKWEPNKQWGILALDIDIDDQTIENVRETETNVKEKAKTESDEANTEAKKTPDNTNEDDKAKEDTNDSENEEPTGEEEKVLEFFPTLFGHDIAKANKKGPRKDNYSLKGCFHDLSFIKMKGGMTDEELKDMMGEILSKFMKNVYSFIADKPCTTTDNKHFEVNKGSNYKEDDERPELGDFTNKELTDILNNPKNAKQYLTGETEKIKIAKSEKDKEHKKELEKKNKEALKKDPKLAEKIKNINPKLVDDNGELTNDAMDAITDYQIASKRKSKKSKGIFSRFIKGIKTMLGIKQDDMEKIDDILQTNESYKDIYNAIIEEDNEEVISLTEYLKNQY